MTVSSEFIIQNYPRLKSRAISILHFHFSFDPYECESYAEDITTRFLFSRSLSEVYPPEKGELLPFFNSYVQKSVMGIREKLAAKKSYPLYAWTSNASYVMAFSSELDNWLNSIYRVLRGRVWQCQDKILSLEYLCRIIVAQTISEGLFKRGVNQANLSRVLKISKEHLVVAIRLMRDILYKARRDGII